MTYTITKSFAFSAAHHLEDLPVGHKCRNPHGHNYTVRLILSTDDGLDEFGFVEDYGALADVKKFIDEELDHRDLNDWIAQPTAERLARTLFEHFIDAHPRLVQVVVSETNTTTASYKP